MRYEAERRQLAAARREVFVDPPARRNRVCQVDFSAFETTSEGMWQLCGVVDYAAKVALVCPVTATQTAGDLIAALDAAIDAAEALLGRPLIEDCVDEATGEIVPLAVVTDNGPAMKSTVLARWFAAAGTPRPRAHPSPLPVDQRRRRTLVRDPEIRTPLPRRDPQRHRPRRPCRRLHRRIQHDPPPRNAHLATTPRHLPDRPDPQTETPKT